MLTVSVVLMELNAHLKTQKEVGVLLKDSTQLLLNQLKKINHLVSL
jgi:hypothetical protein